MHPNENDFVEKLILKIRIVLPSFSSNPIMV